ASREENITTGYTFASLASLRAISVLPTKKDGVSQRRKGRKAKQVFGRKIKSQNLCFELFRDTNIRASHFRHRSSFRHSGQLNFSGPWRCALLPTAAAIFCVT